MYKHRMIVTFYSLIDLLKTKRPNTTGIHVIQKNYHSLHIEIMFLDNNYKLYYDLLYISILTIVIL